MSKPLSSFYDKNNIIVFYTPETIMKACTKTLFLRLQRAPISSIIMKSKHPAPVSIILRNNHDRSTIPCRTMSAVTRITTMEYKILFNIHSCWPALSIGLGTLETNFKAYLHLELGRIIHSEEICDRK